MKKLLAALAAVLVFASMAFAADQFKVGSVDFQRALNDSAFGAQTRAELESTIRSHQAKIDEQTKKLDAMKKDLETQAAVLSEDAYRQRQEEVDKFERDLKRQVNDSNEELQKLQRRKEYEILKELDGVVAEIAKEDGYNLVLPVDVIIYSSEGLDITDKVIARYDKEKKDELKKDAKKPAEGK
jgi:outer membrane protein